MQNILNFIYQGEVSVNTEDLSSFFEVANNLKIKGLSNTINISQMEDSQVTSQDNNINNLDGWGLEDLLTSAIDETSEEEKLENQNIDNKVSYETDMTDYAQKNLSPNSIKEPLIPNSSQYPSEDCFKKIKTGKRLKDNVYPVMRHPRRASRPSKERVIKWHEEWMGEVGNLVISFCILILY